MVVETYNPDDVKNTMSSFKVSEYSKEKAPIREDVKLTSLVSCLMSTISKSSENSIVIPAHMPTKVHSSLISQAYPLISKDQRESILTVGQCDLLSSRIVGSLIQPQADISPLTSSQTKQYTCTTIVDGESIESIIIIEGDLDE